MATQMNQIPENTFEDYLPPEMAKKGEEIGIRKANLGFVNMFALAVLAGAFISLGAVFATITWTNPVMAVPWGWGRAVGGLAFSLGLILVIVGGAELFTGNNLIVMAWASRRLSTRKLLRNWVIVYLGNIVGAIATADPG
jgi:formate transporter